MRILTIDLDILMHKQIENYNDLSSKDTNPTNVWRNIYNTLPYLQTKISYDSKMLLDLFCILQSQSCEIIFIEEHDQIVPYIKTKCDLVNIDFHHDIYYEVKDYAKGFYGCGNWIGYLDFKGLLNSYTWYGTENSKQFKGKDFEFTKKLFKDIQLDRVLHGRVTSLGKFDKVFICKSPRWLPPEFWHLFEIMKVVYAKN